MADISIFGQGFYVIHGLTDEGREWLAGNVEGYEVESGIAYSDNSGYTQAIATGAADDGLSVTVNGAAYAA